MRAKREGTENAELRPDHPSHIIMPTGLSSMVHDLENLDAVNAGLAKVIHKLFKLSGCT
ncbi:hypothetical protein KUIN1_01900 [Pseudomonas sp. KUIN-1]|nr:hypothetical protein KUIN1_01900 [Pseudomonas sp. KUIN-1]